MQQRIAIAGACALAVALSAATVPSPPAEAAFKTKEDDLRWVATGSEPSVNYSGRYIAFTQAGADSTYLGWRDMNTNGPKVGRTQARYPSLGYDWTAVVWTGPGRIQEDFCGFQQFFSQVYGASAGLVAKPASSNLVSKQSAFIAAQLAGAAGDSRSEKPVLCGDGGAVAFESLASNLAPGVFEGCNPRQIFLRDFSTQTTRLISIGMDGKAGNFASRYPSVSETGRYVAFESAASNLVPDDQFSSTDVFLRDTKAGTTALVSHADGSSVPTGGTQPAVSGDGRWVAYTAPAPKGLFGTGGSPLQTVVYLRDMADDTSAIVSRGNGPDGAPVNADRPSISADGRYVSFMTNDPAAVPDPVTLTAPNGIVRDVQTGENRLGTRAKGKFGAPLNSIDGNGSWPRLSGNGRYLVFWTESDAISPFGVKGEPDIYLRDVWGPQGGVDTKSPVLTGVKLTKKSIVQPADCDNAIETLSQILLTSSEPASLRVEFRQKSGQTVTVVATLLVAVTQGKNAISLTGCVGLDLLPKGKLTLTVQAFDAERNASKIKLLALKVQ